MVEAVRGEVVVSNGWLSAPGVLVRASSVVAVALERGEEATAYVRVVAAIRGRRERVQLAEGSAPKCEALLASIGSELRGGG